MFFIVQITLDGPGQTLSLVGSGRVVSRPTDRLRLQQVRRLCLVVDLSAQSRVSTCTHFVRVVLNNLIKNLLITKSRDDSCVFISLEDRPRDHREEYGCICCAGIQGSQLKSSTPLVSRTSG